MNGLIHRCIRRFVNKTCKNYLYTSEPEPQMIASGWDYYASKWKPDVFQQSTDYGIQHIGDEWTVEVENSGQNAYGLDHAPSSINFDQYISEQLLIPYLPSNPAEGLEIGPGGGRLTALLLKTTRTLHVAEPSKSMIQHLKNRFGNLSALQYHQTDGKTLPALRPESLDYVVSFDVFVHFEPRLIYWYLSQIQKLLKPGGTGIIHYSNVLTMPGWQLFEQQLERNVDGRTEYGAFGVMCPQLMTKFLEVLKLEISSVDVGVVPRDGVAVFHKSSP